MLSLIHVCSGPTETVVVHHHIQTSNAYDLGTGHLYVALLLTRHVVEHNTPTCVTSACTGGLLHYQTSLLASRPMVINMLLVCVVATHSIHRHLY